MITVPFPRGSRTIFTVVIVVAGISFQSCKDLGEDPPPATGQAITVRLRNADTFQYPTVGGDEEGAIVSTQPRHFRISEIRRDASTNFICVYVYQPEAGYTGYDHAELDIYTNKVGTPEHTQVTRLAINFTISN
jgi:hypothetical protein